MRRLVLPAGLAAVAGLLAADLVEGSPLALTSALVLPPLAVAVLGRFRDTATVAAAAALAGLLILVVDGIGEDGQRLVGVGVVALGAGSAVGGRWAQRRTERERRRLELLAAVGEVSDGRRSLPDTLDRLGEIVVPAIADVWLVDALLGEDGVRRLAVRAHDAPAGVEEALLRRRPLGRAQAALRAGERRVVVDVDDGLLDEVAGSDADRAVLAGGGARQLVVLPLRARGLLLGTLTFVHGPSGRRFAPDDLAFAESLASRVALALDNAGLRVELTGVERRLEAILASLDDAVTVQTAALETVYANEAAARLLTLPSPEAVVGARPEALLGLFDVFDEEGREVRLEDFPVARVVRGERAEPHLVRNIVRATGEERWLLSRSTPVHDDEGELVYVVNVIQDVTTQKRHEDERRLLAEAGQVLARSLDYERTLEEVARLAVPQLANWCAVDLPAAHDAIVPVAVTHEDAEKAALGRTLRDEYPVSQDEPVGLAAVLRGEGTFRREAVGDDELVAYARDDRHLELLRAVGFGSLMIVPMPAADGRPLGALTFVSAAAHRFGPDELALAEELGRRAGRALENARLSTERARIAHTLQVSLLPGALPEIEGWRTALAYQPVGEAIEAGGDFYDVFPAGHGWVVIVGDVAGKGARAAGLTGLARHTLRTASRVSGGGLDVGLHELNGALLEEAELALCTACAIGLDGEWARVLRAGHPAPVLLRDGDAAWVGEAGPLLGAWEDVSWPEEHVGLRAGDVLVLYTDGVLDTEGPDGEHFGEDRVLAALRGAPPGDPEAALERLEAARAAFRVVPDRDDVAVLAVARTPAAAPRRVVLPGDETGPAAARDAVREHLGPRLDPRELEQVLVLTSELVTNAVRHGRASPADPPVLGVEVADGRVRVAVEDPGPGFSPDAARTEPGADGGFGLMLVDGTAEAWGVDTAGRTRVWFEVAAGARPAA